MNNNKNFIHLHNHSEFSAFDGLSKVENMAMTAREMGFPAIALTDHGNISGALKLIKYCNATKDKNNKPINFPTIKPIIGNEFYLSFNHKTKAGTSIPEEEKGIYHITILAQNWVGYKNLAKLTNTSWKDGFYYKPRIDINLLAEHSDGLIVFSGCPASIISSNILSDRINNAKNMCSILKDIFKDRFFMEIMFHGLDIESYLIPILIKMGIDLKIKTVATNDCHYVKKEHASSHDVLLCSNTYTCVKNPNRMKFPYDEFYIKSFDEMNYMFKDIPFVLKNTLEVGNMIDTDSIVRNIFGVMRLPKYKVPEGFKDPQHYLEHLTYEGAKKNGWINSERHLEAIRKELADIRTAYEINGYDFPSYFLMTRDDVKYARKNGIFTGPGRGSSYASLVCRCIGINSGQIDPLDEGLIWERFLGFQDKIIIRDSDFGIEDNKERDISIHIEESEESEEHEEQD